MTEYLTSLRDRFLSELLATTIDGPLAMPSAIDFAIANDVPPQYFGDFIAGLLCGEGITQCHTCRVWCKKYTDVGCNCPTAIESEVTNG